MRSIDVVIRELCLAVNDGKQARGVAKEGGPNEGSPTSGGPGERGADRPRRSSRARFRSDDAPPAGEGETNGDSSGPVTRAAAGEPAKA